jgi:hypothetical protein
MTIPVPEPWLLAAPEPWTRFQTRLLLRQPERSERGECLRHPVVRDLLARARAWPCDTTGAHQSAKDPLNKLAMLADFGVRAGDPGVAELRRRLLATVHADGRVRSPVLMPRAKGVLPMFDIDGQDPLLALAALGYGADPDVIAAARALLELRRSDGGFVWPDAPSPLPCRKDAGGCPYPTLKILRLLAHVPLLATEDIARPSTDLVLDLWSRRRREQRYGFGMGERFAKLKYPFIWFDILHVAEALSPFPWVWSDARFREITAIITSQADAEGRFVPGSVWMEWKGQCFAQKTQASPWLTVVVHRMLARCP